MKIGVDLGGTNIRAGQVLESRLVKTNQSLLTHKDSLSSTLDQLISVIAPLAEPGVTGIGIGVPSAVDTKNGIVYNVVNIPSWEKVELKKILEDRFQLPVYVNNDVNCFVLGEHQYGEAGNYSSVVALALGTGLGSGIIINGSLYEGSNGGAGEIGYLRYLDSIYEDYVSSKFFETRFGKSGYRIHQEALQGEKSALDAWEEFGGHLGNVIQSAMYVFDPEAIVLGGSISSAFPFFEASVRRTLEGFLFPTSVQKIRIYRSSLENAALYGAAALVPSK